MIVLMLALAAATPEECPISPQLSSLSIRLLNSDDSPAPGGRLVQCRYGGGIVTTALISFQPKCPAQMTLLHAGYNIEPPYTQDVRVVGFVPKPTSDRSDAIDIVVYATNAHAELSTYAYCVGNGPAAPPPPPPAP